jgi:DNA-binding response OmpR family regulator
MTSAVFVHNPSLGNHLGNHGKPATENPSANHRLTRKERELLSILMQNPGRCISREILLRTVWNYADGARTRTVDVHVQRLRRKLGEQATSIKTIVRLGYCWYPDPDTLSRPTPVW